MLDINDVYDAREAQECAYWGKYSWWEREQMRLEAEEEEDRLYREKYENEEVEEYDEHTWAALVNISSNEIFDFAVRLCHETYDTNLSQELEVVNG
jgi:hypothetical protein